MDLISILPLAQAAEKASTMFDMGFVKWLAGFLVAGYAPLLYYLKGLLDQRKELLEKQVVDSEARSIMTEKIRKEIEGEVRERWRSVVETKDKELSTQEDELKSMRADKLKMLAEQIEDGHRQEKHLAGVTDDYRDLVDALHPIIVESVDVLQYYRRKRERG
jgi:hypothetical protein